MPGKSKKPNRRQNVKKLPDKRLSRERLKMPEKLKNLKKRLQPYERSLRKRSKMPKKSKKPNRKHSKKKR